jgi:hypothetical protein
VGNLTAHTGRADPNMSNICVGRKIRGNKLLSVRILNDYAYSDRSFEGKSVRETARERERE